MSVDGINYIDIERIYLEDDCIEIWLECCSVIAEDDLSIEIDTRKERMEQFFTAWGDTNSTFSIIKGKEATQ